MPKAIHSARHRRLTEILIAERHKAGLTQADVANAVGRHQPFIANIESGQRRVDLIELMDLADIIGLDVRWLLIELGKIPSERRSSVSAQRRRRA